MVIKPTDIVNWDDAGEKLESHIDNKLRNDWKGAGTLRFDLPLHLPMRIVCQLMTLYKKAGWIVSHHQGQSQKDGDWNYLEFSENKQAPMESDSDRRPPGPKGIPGGNELQWSSDGNAPMPWPVLRRPVANIQELLAREIARWSWTSGSGYVANCPDSHAAAGRLVRILEGSAGVPEECGGE